MSKKAREGSLGSKLLNLRPGEFMILPEPDGVTLPVDSIAVATSMERQVQNIIHKSQYLSGRKFKTWRCDVIRNRTLFPMLGIERTE